LAGLGQVVGARGLDVLIPMTDVSAEVALGLRDGYPDLVVPFPPKGVWSEVADKKRLMEVAGEVGVPVPRQIVVEKPESDLGPVLAWATHTGFPVVLKPHRSAVLTEAGVQSFTVRMASDSEALISALSGYREAAFPVLVQERIDGPGLGAFFLSMEGAVLSSFAHRRLREKPPTGGVSVLRVSVPLRDDIRRHSEALLRHFAWSGVAMVEFKEDSATGTPYLMEINGRFWGSLQLSIDAGVDFPVLLLDRFLQTDPGSAAPVSSSYAPGVRSRWLWGDVDHLWWILRSGTTHRRSDPQLPGRLGALGRFLAPWRRRQRFEVLRFGDLRPFLRETFQWIRDVLPWGRGS
jgi:predicted ATP-grasp superfamily ATP-dependent carboligase